MHALTGTPHRPATETDREIFVLMHCGHCARNGKCTIASYAKIFEIGETYYPQEWVHDDDGQPTCMAFTLRRPPEGARCPDTLDMFGGAAP